MERDQVEFRRGEVDFYSWRDLGSTYAIGELNAAFLLAQLEQAEATTARRLAVWDSYQHAFAELEQAERVRRPTVPSEGGHKGHLYYLLLGAAHDRAAFIESLRLRGVEAVFHYVPLHLSEFGGRAARSMGELPVTSELATVEAVNGRPGHELRAARPDALRRIVHDAQLRMALAEHSHSPGVDGLPE